MTNEKAVLQKVFFFCRPSVPAYFNEPVHYTVKYRRPLARYLIGSLPLWLARHFMTVHVSERIVELPFVFANLRPPKGSVIVDMGCVESPLSIELANRGFKVLGVDLRPYPFRHPNLTAILGDFARAPIPDDSVDAVLAVSSIEHFGLHCYGNNGNSSSDLKAIEKAKRILKPGGQLILTVPFGVKAQTGWYRVYDCAALQALLADFQVERCEYYKRRDLACWEETDLATAAQISSPHESNCVALLSAFVIKDQNKQR